LTIICTSPQKPQGVDLVCPLFYSILHFSFFKKERKRRMPGKKHYYYVGGSTNCHNKLTCSKVWAYTKLWEWIPQPLTLSIGPIEHRAICVMCVIVASRKHRFCTWDIFVVENYLCEFHIGQIYTRRWAKHDLLSWWGTSPTTTKKILWLRGGILQHPFAFGFFILLKVPKLFVHYYLAPSQIFSTSEWFKLHGQPNFWS
jgi:hypothetical protein